MKKSCKKLFCIIMSLFMLLSALPLTVHAVGATVHDVGTPEALSDACVAINENGGEYVINLTADITNGYIEIKNPNAVVTVIGNGHTLARPNGYTAVYVSNGATVNLGDRNSELIISGDNGGYVHGDNDNPGLVYVLYGSTCNMYDKVTIKDHKGNNYLGGGVSVEGGTFNMHGGTIQNCGIDGGSVCFGGGVAVYNGGSFVLKNGTIKDCFVKNGPQSDPSKSWQAPWTAGGGVFVCRADFTMDGGTIENCKAINTDIDNDDSPDAVGGGVAVITSLDSIYDNYNNGRYGYLDSSFTMNGGTIKGCSATVCGGALVAGLAYIHNEAIGTAYHQDVSGSDYPGIFLNGGTMTENEASEGGAIFLNWIRQSIPVNIKNMTITSNSAYMGAGIESKSFWTQTTIDGCTITGNTAESVGGGIYLNQALINGQYPCQTYLKNSTITNNTSGDKGAGVYYNSASNLMISGANTIQNNTYNGKLNNLNVLSKDYPVYVDGALTGSQIGLSDPTLWDDGLEDTDASAVSTEYLTSGYKENNPEDHPSEYFTSDHETWIVDRSEQTKEETVDPSSVTYREYTVNRYPYIPASDPKLNPLYGQNNEYVYSEIKNPDIDKISSFNDLYNEMKYKYSDTSKYTKSTDVNNNGNIFLKYSILDSTYPTTLTIQKTSSNDYASVVFSQSPLDGKGGNVTYRVYLNDQTLYADTKELVYKVFGTSDNISNSYAFSEDYTTISIKYVNTNPPADTIYEYDDYGNLTAKLEIVGGVSNYTLKQKTTEIITGNTDEVRLVRADINYHINNDVIDDQYGNNDIFTDEVEAKTGEIKVGETIKAFYAVPEVTPTKQNSCPYIFKGWYYDQANDDDSHPVVFGTDKYTKDIYAHWIKVENVAPDKEDDNILPEGETEYGGFDLSGVQVREGVKDTNFGYEKKPGGLRFLTSLSMDVVNKINAIKPNNIEYGYVAATNEDWIDYHSHFGRKLLYVSDSDNPPNGIDTASDKAENKNYFGFAKNIKCTSKKANSKVTLKEDHRNYGGYLLYTLVITYENSEPEDFDKNVLARPYIKYTDANNLERVAYSEYRGNSNVLGGCYTSYNANAGAGE